MFIESNVMAKYISIPIEGYVEYRDGVFKELAISFSDLFCVGYSLNYFRYCWVKVRSSFHGNVYRYYDIP